MPAERITLEINADPFLPLLKRMEALNEDATPLMDAIGEKLAANARQRINNEETPTGERFREWSEAYARSYPWTGAKSGHGKILDRSGHLANISHIADHESFTVGSPAEYAVFHEFGKTKPRRAIFFAHAESGTLGDEDEESILDLLEAFLIPDD
ncbi:MAG: phage virion morphogenesis protein [Zoogloeaceae bacterium]|jgi:phage virion morphogenesis protein|nr:phage virion morphogenesis protein [Zoogloeaceae bacterium]